MRLSVFCALAAAVLAFPASSVVADDASELDRIVRRATEAVGGRDALLKLANVRILAEWTEGGRYFTGDYRATRDGRMRIDVDLEGKRVFSEGVDRTGAWEQPGEGAPVKDVGDAQERALLHGVNYRFWGIWLAKEARSTVTALGSETIGGTRYEVVGLRLRDGFETYLFVNPATWHVERQRDTRAYHPSNDPKAIVVESVYSGFRKHCGVSMPPVKEDRNADTGEVLSTSRVKSVACNQEEGALDIQRPQD